MVDSEKILQLLPLGVSHLKLELETMRALQGYVA